MHSQSNISHKLVTRSFCVYSGGAQLVSCAVVVKAQILIAVKTLNDKACELFDNHKRQLFLDAQNRTKSAISEFAMCKSFSIVAIIFKLNLKHFLWA